MANYNTLSSTCIDLPGGANELALYSMLLVSAYADEAAADSSLNPFPSPEDILLKTDQAVEGSNLAVARIAASYINRQFPEFGAFDDDINEQGFELNLEDDLLYISHDENLHVQKACNFISVCLAEFNVDKEVPLTYANTCSRSLPDCFSGGVSLIDKNGFEVFNQSDALAVLMQRSASKKQSD